MDSTIESIYLIKNISDAFFIFVIKYAFKTLPDANRVIFHTSLPLTHLNCILAITETN